MVLGSGDGCKPRSDAALALQTLTTWNFSELIGLVCRTWNINGKLNFLLGFFANLGFQKRKQHPRRLATPRNCILVGSRILDVFDIRTCDADSPDDAASSSGWPVTGLWLRTLGAVMSSLAGQCVRLARLFVSFRTGKTPQLQQRNRCCELWIRCLDQKQAWTWLRLLDI